MSQCTAKSSRTGERCKRHALRFSNVCPSHGAAAPQVRQKARERELVAAATASLVQYDGEQPEIEVEAELLRTAHETVALKDWLGQRASEMQSATHFNKDGDEALRAVIAAYLSMLEKTGALLVKLQKLGVTADQQERRRNQARQTLAVLMNVLQRTSPETGLTHEQILTICEHFGLAMDSAGIL